MAAAILSSLRRKSLTPFLPLLRLRCLATASPAPSLVKDFVEYCGLSPTEAAKAAKACTPIEQLQSANNPEAFISFMRSQGFAPDHIRRMITKAPKLLLFNVKRTLASKLESFRSIGFSESALVDVLTARPGMLLSDVSGSIVPKLRTWVTIFGSTEVLADQILTKGFIFTSDADNVVSNIKFLKEECGIRRETIYLFVRKNVRFIVQKTDSLRVSAERADELGVPRKSGMFLDILFALSRLEKEDIDAKLELMRSIGCSHSDFIAAILKAPNILTMSNELLLRKVDVLVNKSGLSPSYIARRPILLALSLEKRIIPRVRVIQILKSEGLLEDPKESLFKLNDRKFSELYVRCHMDKVPKLRDLL